MFSVIDSLCFDPLHSPEADRNTVTLHTVKHGRSHTDTNSVKLHQSKSKTGTPQMNAFTHNDAREHNTTKYNSKTKSGNERGAGGRDNTGDVIVLAPAEPVHPARSLFEQRRRLVSSPAAEVLVTS